MIKIGQTNLSTHLDKKGAIELCPNCWKPLTPYWKTILIEPYEDKDTVILTMERKCDHCDYKEQDQAEQLKSIICNSGCSKCVGNCRKIER